MKAIDWKDGRVRFLDQTLLPNEEVYIESDDPNVVAEAIRRLAIRGAPLIGIAAAYAVALGAQRISGFGDHEVRSAIEKVINMLRGTRPTAINLFWALNRQEKVVERFAKGSLSALVSSLIGEAKAIHEEDREMCVRIGSLGAEILPNAASVLTHCNTGGLATGGTGTAQSVISAAWNQHKLKHVYVDETRPLFQGARLTAWELRHLGIPATLITDGTGAFLMQRHLVNAVIVGADRIALNGDVANKVGTYNLAVVAKHHAIPMYVAAPTSSIDFSIETGKEIPIEQRNSKEVTEVNGRSLAPSEIDVYSPAFDVTPGELITALITEEGVLHPPFRPALESMQNSGSGHLSAASR